MEVKCLIDVYHFACGTLHRDETTALLDVPEAEKARLLADHPDWFEVVNTPEDRLPIETPEGKLPATRKK